MLEVPVYLFIELILFFKVLQYYMWCVLQSIQWLFNAWIFQHFSMINSTVKTNFVHMCFSILGSASSGYIVRSEIAELKDRCPCSFIKYYQAIVVSICNPASSVWLCFLLFLTKVCCQALDHCQFCELYCV